MTARMTPVSAELVGRRPVAGGDICQACAATLAGRQVFAKTHPDPPRGLFAVEAAGLRWLRGAGAPTPEVLAYDDSWLVLEWVDPGEPTVGAAEDLGWSLAKVHAAGADAFGSHRPGFVGTLPLDNTPAGDWPTFYGQRRLLPFAWLAARRGALPSGDVRAVERLAERLADPANGLAGPPEPPARLHGDLWGGNVLWARDGRARLIDPAAYGGHRETDLAMLALFGLPYLDRLLGAYDEAAPLADGWRDRVALHQLFPLLVHAALFGGGYGARAGAVARRYL